MSNVKKAIVLVLAILLIFTFATNNNVWASAIPTRNSSNNASNNVSNNSSNNSSNNASNVSSNNASNNSSNVPNTSSNSSFDNYRNNVTQQLNSTNSEENIPHTGITDTYFSFALIILLAFVLGMFSFVQYNKITKKENDD